MIFCPNCGKLTGYKRALGFGTLFAIALTAGFWLLALPFYPKRCITCGLRKSDSVPWYSTWRLGLVLAIAVVAFGAAMDELFPSKPSHPALITHGPDYDKLASMGTAQEVAAAPLAGRPTPVAPDVIDPTHSSQWTVGGISLHENFRRMTADSSGPLTLKGATDNWTWPKLVYSDPQENIYIEADAVEIEPIPAYADGPRVGDPGWGNLLAYLRSGQFGGWFVTEFKDPELTRPLIGALVSAHPKYLHPELLKYRTQELWFDLPKGTMTGTSLSVQDTNGDFLAAPSSHGTYLVRLTPDSRWNVVARNIASLLEQAENDPKIADGIERVAGKSAGADAPTLASSPSVAPQLGDNAARNFGSIGPAATPMGIGKTAQHTDALPGYPSQLQFEGGTRLVVHVTSISRQPDGRFTFRGTLLQPVTLAGGVGLDQTAELTGLGAVNGGHATVSVTYFSLRGKKYALRQAPGKADRQSGTGPAIELDPGKVLEMWFAAASIYEETGGVSTP